MPSAWVIEILSDKSENSLGLHDFVQIPATNDQISLTHDDGAVHVYGVAQVIYAPTRIPPLAKAAESSASVFVSDLYEVKTKR
jgi:hypothetical protein